MSYKEKLYIFSAYIAWEREQNFQDILILPLFAFNEFTITF